jgi:PQQ-dependent dehydrogenase (s-GDH family)
MGKAVLLRREPRAFRVRGPNAVGQRFIHGRIVKMSLHDSFSRARVLTQFLACAAVAANLGACGTDGDSVDDFARSEAPGREQARSTSGASPGTSGAEGSEPAFDLRVVTLGLFAPHELTWGPDGWLWLTERVGRRILRIDPETAARAPVITIEDAIQTAGQDGVMGMALHPELLQGTGNDYVYVAYTYDGDAGPALARRVKIRRYTYDPAAGSVSAPSDLITGLLGSNDHNSGRLVFGPDSHLYYTIGDQGNNQFDRKCLPIRSQEVPTQAEVDAGDYAKYVGKVLRLNLDGSIPDDNPIIEGTRSHIYSYGHRNPQGLVFSAQGKLYSDEHGPKSDDELNLLRPGRNYGWPNVAGYRDGRAYEYADWSASTPTPCEELTWNDYVVPPTVPTESEFEFRQRDFMPPLATFFAVDDDFEFQDPACGGVDYMCWPTIAPSSLDYYPATGKIRQLRHSLLITSMKYGSVFRAKLSRDGRVVVGDIPPFFKTTNRYRDLTISPDTSKIYVITDSDNFTRTPEGGATTELEHRGAILEFTLKD